MWTEFLGYSPSDSDVPKALLSTSFENKSAPTNYSVFFVLEREAILWYEKLVLLTQIFNQCMADIPSWIKQILTLKFDN